MLDILKDKWVCGHYNKNVSGASALLNKKGFKCCLGFLGKHYGLSDRNAINAGYPYHVEEYANWPIKLFEKSSYKVHENHFYYITWERFFIHLNDNKSIDDETREFWIKAGFKILFDVNVNFVGEYI